MMIIHLVYRKRIDAWISGRECKEKFLAENGALRKKQIQPTLDFSTVSKEKFIFIASKIWVSRERTSDLCKSNNRTKIQNVSLDV